ncbi:ubiquinol-cytochrome c reductase iron-sulfur subunit [Accumulibacter sp.]|uniref:Ubiquinol-cytochrome c reductase iron-sulfur subunit n=1 Tax=Candidatus Accumulibacter proximus TaxID=2954385 RepID=A0A935UI55_9PROT|nr:ubiquinol-cytochrome c reductase iron-sulfur subunit [Accumulibacter sp.]MBK7676235.1 ubiquinol-cytochrome c reductase iron-sulfur subunit [Candidatus Accumulibacter proximus]MBL8373629.1 ubiquinol-cytochrome c reductase iron-sulfur subunit [Accumulibacter sp.]
MSDDSISGPHRRRRQVLVGLCLIGAGVGAARYLTEHPGPPAGNPVSAEFSDLPPGKLRVLDWQGRTLWILRRTAEEVMALADHESELIDPRSEQSLQPESCRNRHRSLRPDVFVAIGQCTHQGCTPQLRGRPGAHGEFLCPCHTSKFDLAGRAFLAGPAPANLVIPVYRLDGDSRLVIGEA